MPGVLMPTSAATASQISSGPETDSVTTGADRRAWGPAILASLMIVGAFVIGIRYLAIDPAEPVVLSSLASTASAAPPPPSFEQHFRWTSVLPVEEKGGEAMVVKPIVSEDSSGGLLVADSRESQVRRVSLDGSLLSYFGRPGDGPREFRSLSSVVRLKTGELLTTEISGRITLTDRAGQRAVRVTHVPIQPLLAATVLDDSTVILSGPSGGNLVHLWDPHRLTIRASFFPVPDHPEEHEPAYSFTGLSSVAVRGDTIAALFSLSDELRFFTKTGTEITQMRMRLPYSNFRMISDGGPADASPEAFRVWAESYSVGSRFYWLGNGSFVVQYFDRIGREQKWSTLHMSRDGQNLFEGDTPKLLTVLRRGPEPMLLFEAADNEEPNQWRLASFQ